VTVVMMGEMSLDDWDEKSKKNDQDEVNGIIVIIIIIIIIIILETMFMVLSSDTSHFVSSPGSSDECRSAPGCRSDLQNEAGRLF